jgi:hypothetical protein
MDVDGDVSSHEKHQTKNVLLLSHTTSAQEIPVNEYGKFYLPIHIQ